MERRGGKLTDKSKPIHQQIVRNKRLDIDEQNQNWREVTNAAAAKANSTVQRNPKSNGCGEEKRRRQAWADLAEADLVEDMLAEDVLATP